MREALGGLSGATLGILWNNLKGGLHGYRLGRMAARRTTKTRARRNPLGVRKGSGVTKRRTPTKRTGYRKGAPKRRAPARKVFRRAARRSTGGGSFSKAIAKTGDSAFRIGSGPRLYSGFKRTQLPLTVTTTSSARQLGNHSEQLVFLLPTYRISPGANADDTLVTSNWTVDNDLITRAERWLAAKQVSPSTDTDPLNSAANRNGARWTQKFVCNFINYDQAIRNMGNQDVTITLYDCVLRSGVEQPYLGTLNTHPDPLTDWQGGLKNEGNPSAQSLYPYTTRFAPPGTTPFQASAWCKLYKVKKVTKIVLASGAVHHHHVTVKPRNMWDAQMSSTSTTSVDGSGVYLASRGPVTPGLSGFTICVALGSIMNSAANAVNIGLSKPCLDCVTTTKMSWSNFTRERRFHMTFNGLDLTSTDYQGPLDETDAIAMEGVS